MIPGGFIELSIVIILAAILGVVCRMLGQPIILAYLFTGILIAYFGFFDVGNKETLKLFSELGIMFLLFLVGLEIDYDSLKKVGKDALFVGIGQTVFTFIIGFIIATAFSFTQLESFYIAIALTLSSTIVVVSLLSQKKDLNNLYGKISLGILLVQDFIAIITLVVLASVSTDPIITFGGGFGKFASIFLVILEGIFVIGISIWLGRKLIIKIFDRYFKTEELVFLGSLAWLFLLSSTLLKLGFSIEISGFVAGITLSSTATHFRIANKVRPLRDFFILIFFVVLGATSVLSNFSGIGIPILIFSIFVLVGNPLIVLIVMGVLGFRKRTSFLTGITIAQISEFSLILVALGLSLGHITESVASLVTIVGVITIVSSSYMIVHVEKMYGALKNLLTIFERKNAKREYMRKNTANKPIILVGFNRTGQSIAMNLPKESVLVVECDPDIIEKLDREGFSYLYGDINDPDILSYSGIGCAKVIISTSPDHDSNSLLLEELSYIKKKYKNSCKIVMRARTEMEAKKLYMKGADYVLLPHFTAGKYMAKIIRSDPKLVTLVQLKKEDLEQIITNPYT